MSPNFLLYIGAALFSIGTFGVLSCRNTLILLMSIEIMLTGVSLSLVTFSWIWANSAGQIFVIFIMAVAAGEAAIGLAIIMAFYRLHKSVQTDKAELMKG
ncbi:MAG: NADH-quinone oxidoreductase subunit NuoK [Planctomycetota bacterium]|nr:MAG: NADH-quinone oxidoreductase subunit NuoK [Planctomycetota bacterium]